MYNKIAKFKKIAQGERMMGNEYFAKRIKSLREQNGLSMEQLANQFNSTKSRVSMWENNGTVPRVDILVKLANYFNVTTDYLLGNDDMSNVTPENGKLNSLQRNLGKLNEEELKTAEGMLKLVFKDIFEDEEDDDDI